MSLLQEGQIIRGTYEIERLLGEGAFAEVYRVKHRFLGRQAMKVFKMVGMTVKEIEQLLEEAVMLSRLGHPNIVRVFDANVTDTSRGMCGFFTMEHVAGGSLDQFWRSHGARYVPVETTVEILRQVCRGLSLAHQEQPPIVHRDLKPQNILVGYDGAGVRVRVSDFGLAKRVNPLTLLASAKGTRAFKAPEVFDNPQSDSCAGDVWALGTMLYLLLTDDLPYPDTGIAKSRAGGRFERPIVVPSRRNLQADPMLDRIVLCALAMDPAERYLTAQEMLAELESWSPTATSESKVAKSHIGTESKMALGEHSPADEDAARDMVAQAITLAQQAGNLLEAADLMEEACNRWPGLREKHAYRLQLWRRGIVM